MEENNLTVYTVLSPFVKNPIIFLIDYFYYFEIYKESFIKSKLLSIENK